MQQASKSKKGFVIISKNIAKSIYRFLESIFLNVFPVLSVLKASYIINHKMAIIKDGLEYSYMEGAENLSMKQIELYFEKTFDFQKTFEDKAKTNVFAVSLSVTVITGVTGLLLNLENGNALLNNGQRNIILILSGLILFYSICASLLSLYMIGGLNQMYHIFPSEECLDDNERKKILIQRTELNVKLNTKRNNYLYGSVKNIIISLCLLLGLFIIIVFVTYSPKKVDSHKIEDKQQAMMIELQSIEVIQSNQDNNIQDLLNSTHEIGLNVKQQNNPQKQMSV